MSWIIQASPRVLESLTLLDPSLRDELKEQVARVAEERGGDLRSLLSAPGGQEVWVHEYESSLVETLRITLAFERIEGRERRLVLISIRHSMAPPPEEAK